MSIAVLIQVYDEMRRLAIAGSMVAPGDFRLKKLISPLEQAGVKAPVFAKVGQAVQAVVESKESTSAPALLELTTLVNAILYTQGETGLAGALEPIETTAFDLPTSQAGARTLKPLLEALRETGGGRLEIIRDAFERGAFRDLRLVRPALAAIDDVYSELASFIAEAVLPQYGKAILPDLRASFALSGRVGHPRRLRLMHALDPVGTRDLVKEALEAGSKEVKVAAIECLGGAAEDLSYLLEQTTAKAQDVRQAAYRALADLDHEAAAEALQKTLSGKDLDLAADSLRRSRHPKVLQALLTTAEKELAVLRTLKDKPEISQKIGRILVLLNCLSGREEESAEKFLLQVFAQRDDLAKIKGDFASGVDLNSTVVRLLQSGAQSMQRTLVKHHASLPAGDLALCFQAAQNAMPPKQVFEIFSPYVTAQVNEKKKQRDAAWQKREAILNALGKENFYGFAHWYKPADMDPRWLDLAVQMRSLNLVRQLGRPGHAGASRFLTEVFAETIKKAKHSNDCHEVVASMIHAGHPEATDAFITVLEKFGASTLYYDYWFSRLIVELPKSALPRLEALIPALNDKLADKFLADLQLLRERND